jgi:hypothetical protein
MSKRSALFLGDDAFAFDFTDSVPADAGADEALEVAEDENATAVALVGSKASVKLASAEQVAEAVAACAGAGHSFVAAASKDTWAELRQRHRDCVARAVHRAGKERAAKRERRTQKAGARKVPAN